MTYKNKQKAKSSVKLQESGNRVFVVDSIAPDSLANELVAFNLSIDSVVATATITYETSHRFITIFWGDSDVGETFDTLKIKIMQPQFGQPQLPENTIKVQHVYAEPEPPAIGRNLLFYTLLQDIDGSRKFGPSQRVRVNPRYKFNIYSTTLEFNSHLDSALEQETEISIDMKITHGDNILLDKHWDPDVVTNIGPLGIEEIFPVFFKLPGARLNYEISLGDLDGIIINFVQSERENIAKDAWEFLGDIKDIFIVNFDTSTEATIEDDGLPQGIHPARLSDRGSKTYKRFLDVQDGFFQVIIQTEMKLLVPLDRTSGLLTQI